MRRAMATRMRRRLLILRWHLRNVWPIKTMALFSEILLAMGKESEGR